MFLLLLVDLLAINKLKIKKMMRPKIFILDFEDSFTFNIFSVLIQMEIPRELITVIPYKKVGLFLKNFNPQNKKESSILIYGPGPGHPKDYQCLYKDIKRLLLNLYIFHFGICLGHQIIWNIVGFEVKRSDRLLHGQTNNFCIPNWSNIFSKNDWGKIIKVQCYNSLEIDISSFAKKFPAIKNFDLVLQYYQNQRSFNCMAGRFLRGVTYQFHPESIATSERNLFFQGILKFYSTK